MGVTSLKRGYWIGSTLLILSVISWISFTEHGPSKISRDEPLEVPLPGGGIRGVAASGGSAQVAPDDARAVRPPPLSGAIAGRMPGRPLPPGRAERDSEAVSGGKVRRENVENVENVESIRKTVRAAGDQSAGNFEAAPVDKGGNSNGDESQGESAADRSDLAVLSGISVQSDLPDRSLVYGQHRDVIGESEALAQERARIIISTYKDRTAEAQIVDGDAVGKELPATGVGRTDGSDVVTIDSITDTLAAQSTEAGDDTGSRVDLLLGFLSSNQPQAVRLQALYLLADADESLVQNYMEDSDDLIRYEAERLAGFLPSQ